MTVFCSLALTWLVRLLANGLGFLDKPGAHKQHDRPTPTLGGLAVFIAFVVGVCLSGPLTLKLKTVLRAGGMIVAVGLWDDLRGVNANLKLLALGVASWMLWSSGVHLDVLGVGGWLACLLTFLWLGLAASAFNGVDNADGAAAGLSTISSFFVFAIAWVTCQRDVAIISLMLAGASFGFLFFNYPAPRASIFLGDSGSLFLGFGLATLTVLGQWNDIGWKAAVIALLLVIAPLFDFVFIILVRGLEGRYLRWDDPIRMCARDHLFHRFRVLGLSGRQSISILYCISIWGGIVAFRGATEPTFLTPFGVLLGALMLTCLGFGLSRVSPPPEAYPEKS